MNMISVVIPVKNGHKYLGEALDAIQSQGMDVEVIVVDDGSDDDTSEIASSAGCRVIRHDVSKGPVVAKNSGLRVAQGDFVMFHDHDDRMRPGALRVLYDALAADETAGAVQAMVQDFVSPELSEEEKLGCAAKPESESRKWIWSLQTDASIPPIWAGLPGRRSSKTMQPSSE